MSKVDNLREKYQKINNTTFQKFVNADTTPTKKYLEFYLKVWSNTVHRRMITIDKLIKMVNQFHELLPYVSDDSKDIYSLDIISLSGVIYSAEKTKDEKGFNREEHIHVIEENDNYLILSPKTFKGSLKYGYGTKWCTASKDNPNYFTKYSKEGTLVYVIYKKEVKRNNVQKVAFYLKNKDCPYTGTIEIYNQSDTITLGNEMVKSGWSSENVFRVTTLIRGYMVKAREIKTAIESVEHVTKLLSSIDFSNLAENLTIIELTKNNDYTLKVKETVNEFIEKLKQCNYGYAKT
jgi:hypothetical protein